MPKKKTQSLRCPICRTLVLPGEGNFPFCSDRCRLIDLGKWASGGYVISTPITDPEQLESLCSGSAADSEINQSKHKDSTDDY